MRFSERRGLVPVRSVVQIESMDDALRIQLWNITYACYFQPRFSRSEFIEFYGIWTILMEQDWDRFPGSSIHMVIKEWIKNREWFEVYDLLEELVQIDESLVNTFNGVLEMYMAGYRLLDGKVAPVADSHELSEIEAALTTESPSAAHHLRTALGLLADREKPDYPNSIKESISAVEAFLAPITGKNTLGAALAHLKKTDNFAHPALMDAWSKLYGWTSDEDGVRHGGETVPAERITQALARYVLISCSAFINLMTSEQAAGRLPSMPAVEARRAPAPLKG
ncbi:AbiJ-NTD4 domain-containing protein [Nocardia tengchongensis]|uniref:AbiJ-NTD4 domain-containing protein n=1 Tax=Nocardia tengchongensis TaxID=2055889 RepID=UPI0036CF1782